MWGSWEILPSKCKDLCIPSFPVVSMIGFCFVFCFLLNCCLGVCLDFQQRETSFVIDMRVEPLV